MIADNKGRRPAIMIAYTAMIICTPLMAFSQNAEQALLLRFLLGIFMGNGIPAAWALVGETFPAAWRQTGYCTLIAASVVGSLFIGVMMHYQNPDLADPEHWRELLLFSTVPALITGIFAVLLLSESPHFL